MESFDFSSVKVRRLAGLVFLYLLAILLGFEIFISVSGTYREEALYQVVGGSVAYLVPVLWIWRKFSKKGVTIRNYFFQTAEKHWIQWRHILLITGVLLFFALGVFILTYIPLSHYLPAYVQSILEDKLIYTQKDSAFPLIANIIDFLMGALLAPVVEELVFRGIMLKRFMIKWKVTTSVIVSSAIFGILHFDLIGAFVFGLFMSILYLKTKSLVVPTLCHVLNNSLAFGFTYIEFWITGKEELYTIAQLRSDLWLGGLFFAMTLPCIAYYLYKHWKPKEWETAFRTGEVAENANHAEDEVNQVKA
ncbi:MAG: CPBP family intramembrane metalloprotease [Clostridia bacterium]|nr:CPBP family intramembrane metalloprotease [Clostridia bacterium]